MNRNRHSDTQSVKARGLRQTTTTKKIALKTKRSKRLIMTLREKTAFTGWGAGNFGKFGVMFGALENGF